MLNGVVTLAVAIVIVNSPVNLVQMYQFDGGFLLLLLLLSVASAAATATSAASAYAASTRCLSIRR